MEDFLFIAGSYLVVGGIAGFLAGLLGIGGGVITIPFMFSLFTAIDVPFEWRMHLAIGTSLAIILVTNTSSVLAHHRKLAINWKFFRRVWWIVAIGAVLGSGFAKILKTEILIYVFAGFVGLLAIKMLIPMNKYQLGERIPDGHSPRFVSGGIGFISAIMGIGGGSLTVPYMTLYGVAVQRAVGTSAVIGMVVSFFGGLGFMFSGQNIKGLPEWTFGFIHGPSFLILAITTALVAPAGAHVAHKLSRSQLSIIFGIFLVIAAARLLLSVG